MQGELLFIVRPPSSFLRCDCYFEGPGCSSLGVGFLVCALALDARSANFVDDLGIAFVDDRVVGNEKG